MFPPVRKIAAKHTLRGLMATPGPEKSTEWGNRANRATDIRDSIPWPAGVKSSCKGRSSDSSRPSRLPGFMASGKRERSNYSPKGNRTYSSEHCSGFAPDSLLLRTLRKNIRIPFAGASIRI